MCHSEAAVSPKNLVVSADSSAIQRPQNDSVSIPEFNWEQLYYLTQRCKDAKKKQRNPLVVVVLCTFASLR